MGQTDFRKQKPLSKIVTKQGSIL